MKNGADKNLKTDAKSSGGTLFERKILGSGKSPLEEAFDELGRFLPTREQVRDVAFASLRKPLFWKASGAVVALLTLWTFGPDLAGWAGEKAHQGGETVAHTAAAAWKEASPVVAKLPGSSLFSEQRASFYIADDFKHLRVRAISEKGESGLTLHPDTLSLEDYRVDFFARLDGRPVRWVVRAADSDNHYDFELAKKGKKYELRRQKVVAGEVVDKADPVEVEADLVQDGFNKITVVCYSNTVTTLLNSQGVDYFDHLNRTDGGVGFYAENDDAAARFGEVIVRGNEDAWGRFLSEARRLAAL